LLIHLLASLLLFQTILLLFQSPVLKKYSPQDAYFIALLASVLWAINPVQTQAVTYIVQRMASLAAMFYIWAMYWYLKFRLNQETSRRPLYLLLCCLCFLFSIGSKENGVMLPLSLLALELVFFPIFPTKALLVNTRRWLTLLSLAIVAGGIYYIIQHNYIEYLFKTIGSRPYTLYERLLTEPGIVLFYLSLLFYPLPQRLSVDHEVTISHALFTPWTTLPSIILTLLLIAVALLKRKNYPILSFAILFYFINHLVESTIIPLELIFEHRNYLPSMFLFMPVAGGLNHLINLFSNRNQVIHTAILLFIPLLLIALGWSTYLRNSVWTSEETLWLDALRKAPNNARAYAKLGELSGWDPDHTPERLARSIAYYQKALISYSPRTSFKAAIYGNMGEVFLMYGLYGQAVSHYTKSLAINPRFNNSQYGLVKALVMQGKFDKALKKVAQSLEQDHSQPRFLNIGGLILLRLHKPDAALWSFRQAMHISRNKQYYFYNIGVALSKAGHYKRAEWFLKLHRKTGPDNIKILFSLLENSVRAGDKTKIKQYAQEILQQFSINTIQHYLKNLQHDYRIVPISTELISPVLFQYAQNQIQCFSPNSVSLPENEKK